MWEQPAPADHEVTLQFVRPISISAPTWGHRVHGCMEKCARRLSCQQASVSSEQNGFSLP